MPNIIEITDFQAPELDVYARLTEAQLLNREHPEEGIFIAESPIVIARALDAGYLPISFLCEKKHLEGQAKELLARCGDIPVYTAEFDVTTTIGAIEETCRYLSTLGKELTYGFYIPWINSWVNPELFENHIELKTEIFTDIIITLLIHI